LPDSDLSKPCRVIGDVRSASFYYEEQYDLPYVGVTFKDGTIERYPFCYKGNAYLMSDEGKTLQIFTQPDDISEDDFLYKDQ
jgi:hypothetical protein